MYFAKSVAKNLQVNISEYDRDVQFDAMHQTRSMYVAAFTYI